MNQEEIIQSRVDELIDQFSRACDKAQAEDSTAVVDIRDWGNYFAFDVIGSLTFGKPFGCIKAAGGENLDWARSLRYLATMGIYEQAASRLVGLHSVLQPVFAWLGKQFLRARLMWFLRYRGR